MIAIFCALEDEITDFKKMMQVQEISASKACKIWRGKFGRKESLLVLTGVGKEKAERVTDWVLSQYPLELVISTGFAGALNGKTQVGDIVVYSRLKWGAEEVDCDPDLVSQAMICKAGSPFKSIQGIGVTIDDVCATAESKHRLGSKFAADLVDMESYWIGRIAVGKGIPFLGVRTVFDAVHDDLTLIGRITSGGKIVYWKALKEIIFHFGRLKDLTCYYRNYLKAAQSLAQFMGQLMDNPTFAGEKNL